MGQCNIERNLPLVMLIYCLNISDSRPKMECFCDLVPHLSEGLCLTVNFLVNGCPYYNKYITLNCGTNWRKNNKYVSILITRLVKWMSLLIKCCILHFKEEEEYLLLSNVQY